MKRSAKKDKEKISDTNQGSDSLDECRKLIDELKAHQLELELENEKLRRGKKLLEDQLQKHGNSYNHTNLGRLTFNQEGVILGLDINASKILGKQINQLKGNRLIDFLDTSASVPFNEFLIHVFKSSQKVCCNTALSKRSNRSETIQLEGILSANGAECMIDIVGYNSGQRNNQDLCIESKVKYRLLLKDLLEGAGIVDQNGSIIYINPSGELIFEAAPEELKNRNLKEFINSDQLSIIREESDKWEEKKNGYEVDIVTLGGKNKTIKISFSSHLDRAGFNFFTLIIFTDITESKSREKHSELRHIMAEVSNDFINIKKEYFDDSVTLVLRKFGNFFDIDRSYIFILAEDGLFCNITHEWCKVGIRPQIQDSKDVPIWLMPWWMNKLKKFEPIYIPLTDNLPSEARSEKEILRIHNIKSLLAIPLLADNSLIGFLVFDSIREERNWQDKDILSLTLLGKILGNGFGRIKDEVRLKEINNQLNEKVEERSNEIFALLELNHAIVDNIELIVISTDKNGIIKSFNPFAEKMLGYKAEEVIGVYTPLIFYDPDELKPSPGHNSNSDLFKDSQFFLQTINQNLNQKKHSDGIERTFRSKDGTRINVLVTISKLEDELGNIQGFIGAAFDITRRKNAEEQLIKSENENTAIVRAIPDLLFKIRKDGTFSKFNNHSQNSLYNSEEIFSEAKIDGILHDELCARTREGWRKTLLTKEVTKFEYNLSANNEHRFYENRMIAISDNEGLSIIRDITDSKLNEQYSTIHRNLGFILATTTTIRQALFHVIHSMLQVEDIHAAGVYLINEQTGNLELVAHKGFSSEFIDSVRQYSPEEVHFQIIRKGEPVYGFYSEVIKNSGLFVRENLKQVGVIPIRHEAKFIGSVNIASRVTERLKDTSKIALEIIAVQIGGTLARIKSENALKLSQRNFKLIFDSLNDFMFILSTGGEIIRTNPIVGRVLCYAKDELLGKLISEVHIPERRSEVTFIIKKMARGKSVICSVPLCRKDGESIPVETKFVFGQWNGKVALYGISRDITERQKAEAKLKMQNLAFDAFSLAIIITDIDGIIQWTNSSFSKLSGYPISEIIGKNPRQIVNSGIQDRNFFETLWNTILDGRVWSGEMINRRKDGSLFHEELTITPVINYNGKITSFIAIKIDITKRKEMELALQKSEERWHFAIEGSGDGAWDWNLITDEVFFSDQWKIMLGYSVSEIENKIDEWKRLIHPDDLNSCLSELDKHFNGETEFYYNEYRMLSKDGNYKWILDRGKLIEWASDGKPLRIIGTHKDITGRKLFEEQLQKGIEKEKELSELKSRFVATTSHEFRTPLASILMISDTLISHYQKMNIEQVVSRLTKIKNHVLHLTDIVNNVLQLSKMQEGKIVFRPKDEDFIAMCLNITNEFISAKSIKGQIVFNYPFKTLIARVDERLIIQAINNLISNAIKYSGDDISIKIELKLENNELIFSVKDKGIGIPEEDIKHLFTPFFRANNVSTIQGNGLGLSIVRESVALHGGTVSCSNNVDKGTTFSLHFPVDLITNYSYARKD
ncbi:PAS domain S-box protein [Aquipluma nitroreducens]|nr:PAS domain S-box protein [Aquipluma nitroreducens]